MWVFSEDLMFCVNADNVDFLGEFYAPVKSGFYLEQLSWQKESFLLKIDRTGCAL